MQIWTDQARQVAIQAVKKTAKLTPFFADEEAIKIVNAIEQAQAELLVKK